MPDELRLPIVLVIAALAAGVVFFMRSRTQRLNDKSDGQRRARRDQARQLNEPSAEAAISASVRRKTTQGFGRR